MLFKRYGNALHSVEISFEAKALNEIGFRRDRGSEIPVAEFEVEWSAVEEYSFDARAEGSVQNETEQEMLDALEVKVRACMGALGEGEILVIESEQGKDWPKARHRTRGVIEEGENRLHFIGWIEPPLRIGRYRKG